MRIGDSQPTPPSGPPSDGSQNLASEAAQMDYMASLLEQVANFQVFDLYDQSKALKVQLDQQSQQNPPPIQAMQDELNHFIDQLNATKQAHIFPHWNIANDQKENGHSFLAGLLVFVQQIDDMSDQDPTIHPYVASLDTYMHNGPWDAQTMLSKVSEVVKAINTLGNNSEGTLPTIPTPPSNLFDQT